MQAVHSIYREAGERKRDKLSITCSLCLYMFIDKSFQGLFIYQSLLLPSSSTFKKATVRSQNPLYSTEIDLYVYSAYVHNIMCLYSYIRRMTKLNAKKIIKSCHIIKPGIHSYLPILEG